LILKGLYHICGIVKKFLMQLNARYCLDKIEWKIYSKRKTDYEEAKR
jgi:hypothetical protein